MNLYINGNGFDKAHSLKTNYIDFRDFLYENYPDFLAAFDEGYGGCLESSRDLINESLWKDLESKLSNLDEDNIVGNAESFDLGLEGEGEGEGGDVDVESTMMDYYHTYYGYIDNLKEYLFEWISQLNVKT